jgi:hypothetical protein
MNELISIGRQIVSEALAQITASGVPCLFRRSVYHELEGFDLHFSEPGTPGICFESESCYRAWRHGYEVALTNIPVKEGNRGQAYIFPGGTLMWGRVDRDHNESQNKKRIV